MDFDNQYKHPKWQKKRLEIFNRDEFKCQLCDSEDKNLHVHHKYYKRGVLIWDYPNTCYITCCYSCHTYLHDVKDMMSVAISRIDPMYLECFAKSDLKKVAEILLEGELNAVVEYSKTIKYHG